MRPNSKLFLWLIMGFILSGLIGCATVPKVEKPVEKVKYLDLPFAQAWKAIVTGLATRGEEIVLAEKESNLIVVRKSISPNALEAVALVPGSMAWRRGEAKTNIVVTPEQENRTKVVVNSSIKGIGYNIWEAVFIGELRATKAYELSSNGNLEREYFTMIEAQIPLGKKYEWLEGSPRPPQAPPKLETEQSRGWLGIGIDKVPPSLARSLGLAEDEGTLVIEIIKDGPADRAKILKGDVILELQGEKVKSISDFSKAVANMKPGAKAFLTIIREGSAQDIKVIIGEQK